jgi:hypothetical protein
MAVPTRRSPLLPLLGFVGAVGTVAACESGAVVMPEEYTMALGRLAERAATWQPSEREQVTIRLDLDTVVEPEKPVPITITVHNGSGRPISIGFGRQDAFQVLVARRTGRADTAAVWSPGPTTNMSPEIVTDPLRPGQDTVFQVTWPAQDDFGHYVPPGKYRVRAYVAAQLLQTNRIWTDWRQIEVRRGK